MQKSYVISSYHNDSLAMFESNDFRLAKKELKIKGSFKKDKSVKGIYNGMEIGVFTADNGDKYCVFTDYSCKLM